MKMGLVFKMVGMLVTFSTYFKAIRPNESLCRSTIPHIYIRLIFRFSFAISNEKLKKK